VNTFEPKYLRLYHDGELARRAKIAREREHACDLCARYCRVDRADRNGACRTGLKAWVASYGPHHGEEEPLRGWRGSGTIFFSWCNLRCQYCQNHDISQAAAGRELESEEIAAIMLSLQESGCHNINLVSPSHVVAEILEALVIAVDQGLRLPLVYNTGGYDSPEALAVLDGVIDIYMPDFKFFDNTVASRYTDVSDYAKIAKIALKEMHRQVGDLSIENGIARRGLLVRHLVMPNMLENSKKIFQFIANEISLNTYLNIMPQYRPAGEASLHSEIAQSLKYAEFTSALNYAKSLGLNRLDKDF